MNVKDFRLGNYCQDKLSEEVLIVDEIHKKNIGFILIDETKYPLKKGWQAKPIELSEEWLNSFGFTKVGSNFEKDWLLLHTNKITGTIDFLLNEPKTGIYKVAVLKYVHQLQNLYFALTQKELEIL